MTAPDPRNIRQQKLQMRLSEEACIGFLVSHLPNIRYLTGFTGSAGTLLLGPDSSVFITDGRYRDQAAADIGEFADVTIVAGNSWDEAVKLAADLVGPDGTVAFEADYLSQGQGEKLYAEGKKQFIGKTGLIEDLRVAKDPAEIDAIRRAAAIAFDALEEILASVRVGDRELDVAARLEHSLRIRGSEWHPFETIAASGPRSGLPHARTTDRKIARGDLLLLDFGAQVDGYCADVTRTVVVGKEPDDRQAHVYEVVQEAQRRAISGIRAGILGRDADKLARDVIEEAGFAEAFSHSLGHGLGLEVHENPRLARTSETHLCSGSVVTVEPGVYWADWGGVRIEDDVWIVDENSNEVFGQWQTDLRVVGH